MGPAFQDGRKRSHAKGFGEIVVHAGRAAPFGIALSDAGGHGYDGDSPGGAAFRGAFSNLRGRLISVDAGHLAIHEDGGEFDECYCLQGLFAPGGHLSDISQILHGMQSHHLIHGIIVYDQHALAGSTRSPTRSSTRSQSRRW